MDYFMTYKEIEDCTDIELLCEQESCACQACAYYNDCSICPLFYLDDKERSHSCVLRHLTSQRLILEYKEEST